MERPEYMWQVMNVLSPSKDATRLPTEEEWKSEALRPLREIADSMALTDSPISKVFPQKIKKF